MTKLEILLISRFAVLALIILVTSCASAPTYSVVTKAGDTHIASSEPIADAMGYFKFKDKKGKKVSINKDDVVSIIEN